MGLPFGIFTSRNDADALTFDVFKEWITTAQIEGDVLYPTNCPFFEKGIVFVTVPRKGDLGL